MIVGGAGSRTTPRLAARFASEFNTPFLSPADAAAQFDRVREACRGAGRDPGSVRLSSAVVVCCGTDETEIARRAAAIGREVDELRRNGACGTPAEVAERLGEWGSAGATTAYLQILDLSDLDHLRLIAKEVVPLLG